MIIFANISKKYMDKIIKVDPLNFPLQEDYTMLPINTNCKDVNPEYIQYNSGKHYTLGKYLACSYYNLSGTKFSGNKTYILNIGNFKIGLGSDGTFLPPLHSTYLSALNYKKKEIDTSLPLKPTFTKYDEKKLYSYSKKAHRIRILRNTNEKWALNNLSQLPPSFIYNIPINTSIHCDNFGNIISTQDPYFAGTIKWNKTILYKIDIEDNPLPPIWCLDSSGLPDSDLYGDKSYIVIEF